jgi:hypothetical protein
MIERTPEDEAFEEIERKQLLALRALARSRTAQESFDEWEHSHRPEQYFVERRAFMAGFEAGRRYERLKETND